MSPNPNINLEAPYQHAAAKEADYEANVASKESDLWWECRNSQERCYKLIYAQVDDPAALLAEILHKACKTEPGVTYNVMVGRDVTRIMDAIITEAAEQLAEKDND